MNSDLLSPAEIEAAGFHVARPQEAAYSFIPLTPTSISSGLIHFLPAGKVLGGAPSVDVSFLWSGDWT
jgi:hypothetical protein